MLPDDLIIHSDDYYTVSLPTSQQTQLDSWFGDKVSMGSMVLTEWNKIQKTAKYGAKEKIRLGISAIDAVADGISSGEVLYIGASNEEINSSISFNIVNSFGVNKHKRLLVFNSGKGEYAFARGLISLRSGVEEISLKLGDISLPDVTSRIEQAVCDIQSADISVINTPFINVESICNEVYKLPQKSVPDLILIDNIRFITSEYKSKTKGHEYSIIARKLYMLAKDTRIPIVVTGPLSKNKRILKNFWPTAADMPAKNMLKSFDKVLTVHKEQNNNSDILCVSSVKNRDGYYGYQKIKYFANTYSFNEIIT